MELRLSNIKKFIDESDILLFDMGKIFMFGGDRFDKDQDYEATYRSFDGKEIISKILHEIIFYIYGKLLTRSRDEKYIDNMITVQELIESDLYFKILTIDDKIIIEKVFEYH